MIRPKHELRVRNWRNMRVKINRGPVITNQAGIYQKGLQAEAPAEYQNGKLRVLRLEKRSGPLK